MALLDDCLKQVGGFDETEITGIRWRAGQYAKEGLDEATALARAIDWEIGQYKAEYANFEQAIRQEGGAVEPIETFVARFSRAANEEPDAAPKSDPEADLAPEQQEAALDAEANVDAPEPEPETPEPFEGAIADTVEPEPLIPASTPEEIADLNATINYRRGAESYLDKLLEAEGEGLTKDDVILELTRGDLDDADPRVGRAEIRDAIERAKAERDRSMAHSPDDLEDEQIDQLMDAILEMIRDAGDDAERIKELTLEWEMLQSARINRDRTSDIKQSHPLFKIWKAMTESDQARVKAIVSQFKRGGETQAAAEEKAIMRVVRERIETGRRKTDAEEVKADRAAKFGTGKNANPQGERLYETSSTGRAAEQLKNNVKGAPRTSLFNQGTPIAEGSDYTVLGQRVSGIYRNKTGFNSDGVAEGLEVARAATQEWVNFDLGNGRTKLQQVFDPVPFIVQERTPAADMGRDTFRKGADGKVLLDEEGNPIKVKSARLERGDTAWYDPVTKKVYADFTNMQIARGEVPAGRFTELPFDSIQDAARAKLEGEISSEEFMSLVRRFAERDRLEAENPLRSKAIMDVNRGVVIAPGHRLALMKVTAEKSGLHQIRRLNNKQLKEGLGVRTLLGQERPGDWVVGEIPDGTRPDLASRNKAFKPIPADRRPDAFDGKGTAPNPPAAPEPPKPNLAVKWGSAWNGEPIKDSKIAALIRQVLRRPEGEEQTNEALYSAIQGLETFDWLKNAEGKRTIVATLQQLYTYLDAVAPNGIALPVAKRAEAIESLRTTFDKIPTDQLDHMVRLLERLGGDPNVAPIIRESEVKGRATFVNHAWPEGKSVPDADGAKTNEILMSQNGGDGAVLPEGLKFAHEIGHWAYINILTPEDRLEFWRIIDKYYLEDGSANVDAINDLSLSADIPEEGIRVGVLNSTKSPQEMFANQFAKFLTKQEGFNDLAEEKLWQRMARYVKAIYDRFFSARPIDADLEPLFAKIIPNDVEEVRFAAKKPVNPSTLQPQSRYILNHHNALRSSADALREAIEADSPSGIIENAIELVANLYRLVPSKRQARKVGKESTGTFGPILGRKIDVDGEQVSLATAARSKGNQLAHIIKQGGLGEFKPRQMEESARAEFDLPEGWEIEEMDGSGLLDADAQIGLAEAIVDFIDDGTKKFGTINRILDEIDTVFANKLRDNEGNTIFDADSPEVPDSLKRVSQDLPSENKRSKFHRKAAAARREHREQRVYALAKVWMGAKNGEKLPSSGIEMPNLKSLKENSLVSLYHKHGKTKEGEAILEELARRAETNEMFIEKPKGKLSPEFLEQLQKATHSDRMKVRTPEEIAAKSELSIMLNKALEEGKRNEVSAIIWEMQRRNLNKDLKKAGKELVPALRLSDRKVLGLVRTEIADAEGGVINGVPQSARLHIREAVEMFTHREPATQAKLRTFAYRMFGLMGRTTRSEVEAGNLLSMDDVFKLAQVNGSPTATGVFVDFTSPEFKHVRGQMRRLTVGLQKGTSSPWDLMHEIGHLIMRTGLIDDNERLAIRQQFEAAKDAVKADVMKRRYNNLTPEEVLDRQAEEWFVENWALYLGERVAKGDVAAARATNTMSGLQERGVVSTAIDRLIEAVAYLLNGLIGRKDIKQTFRRLTFYGDVFDNGMRRPAPSSNMASGVRLADFDSFNARPLHEQAAIREFTGVREGQEPKHYYVSAPMSALDDADASIGPRETEYGNVILVTDDLASTTRIGMGIVSDFESQVEAWKVMNANSTDPEARADLLNVTTTTQQFHSAVRSLNDLARLAYKAKGKSYYNATFREYSNMRDKVFDLFNYMTSDSFPVPIEMGTKATYVRMTNPIRMTRDTEVTMSPEIKNLMRFLTTTMLDEYDKSPADLSGWANWVNDLEGRAMDGQTFMDQLLSQIFMNTGLTYQRGHDLVNKFWVAQGHDAVIHTYDKVIEGSSMTSHEAVALLPGIGKTGKYDNASNRIKAIDATEFSVNSDAFYYSDFSNPDYKKPSSVNANTAKLMLHDVSTKDSQVSVMMQQLEDEFAPKPLLNFARLVGRGKKVTEKDVMDVQKSGWFTRTLRANSARMRSVGMNWIADFSENFNPAKDAWFGQRWFNVKNALDALPDSGSKFKQWAKSSVPSRSSSLARQPESHRRIVMALRMGETSSQWRSLSPEEKIAARNVRDNLDTIHQDMKNEQIMVGKIKDYMPQVWNTDAIRANYEGFVTRLSQYLKSETPGRNSAEADSIARNIAAKLLDEDGVYVPPPVSIQNGVEPNIDFQRMIRLDEFKGHYQAMEEFLENDLETLYIKYLDSASKRLHQVREMGLSNHAYKDYLHVGQHGVEAVADLLSSNRIFTKRVKGPAGTSPDAPYEEGVIEMAVPMPFQNRALAMPAAQEAIRLAQTKGISEARLYLLEQAGAEVSPTYTKRVNAIVNAIKDFDLKEDGSMKRVSADDFTHAEGVLRALQGKQANPRTSDMAMEVSRTMRAFNNITLLSWTVLTSFPDLVLPLIRSGDFQAWAKGMVRYASDDVYREEIRKSGVAIENALHQRMVGSFGGDTQGRASKLQSAFFNATGLTPWTDLMREMAGSVALNSFESQRIKFQQGFKSGVPLAQQPRAVRFAHRYMKRYGMDEFLTDPTRKMKVDDPRVAQALIRFADDTIFAPNPDDVPLWAQTPGGAILFQLKSFPMMMGRLAKDVLWDDLKAGDLRRPMYFATLAPLFGMGAMAMKDAAQGKGGEDGRQFFELQNRSLFGEEEDNDLAGWYVQGLMAAGGFGLVADLMNSFADQVDNGAYGQGRMASAIGGPTVGTGYSVFNVAAGGIDYGKELIAAHLGWDVESSNAKERQAVREIIGRVPMIGGMRAAKEEMVDLLAGEKGGGKDTGWGSWRGDN